MVGTSNHLVPEMAIEWKIKCSFSQAVFLNQLQGPWLPVSKLYKVVPPFDS